MSSLVCYKCADIWVVPVKFLEYIKIDFIISAKQE